MSNKRLIRDYQNLNIDAEQNNFFVDDSIDLSNINVIIIGPKDTPYEGGFFWIKLNPNDRYPFESPKGTFMSPVRGLRVHPNLYCEGKICLSILGTWQGPSWTSLLNFSSIILSIQSILCDNPIVNEPSCEHYKKNSDISINYNIVVKYTTLKIILNFLQQKYSISAHLQNKIETYVLEHIDEYNKLFEDADKINIFHVNDVRFYGLHNMNLNFNILYQEWNETINLLIDKNKIINIKTTSEDKAIDI
jgi:ubiquitin-conjugating enzyme E2 Z